MADPAAVDEIGPEISGAVDVVCRDEVGAVKGEIRVVLVPGQGRDGEDRALRDAGRRDPSSAHVRRTTHVVVDERRPVDEERPASERDSR